MIHRAPHRLRDDIPTASPWRQGVRTALAATALLTGSLAQATALLGGTISLNMAGSGTCAFNASVPTTTPQDTFALSGATPALPICGGRTMSAAMQGDAATPSVGLKLSASGPLTTGSALVKFIDEWTFTVPAGTPTGLVMFPVTFSLDGVVSPGATYAPAVRRFLDYTFALTDKSGFADPLQTFRVDGQVTSTGTLVQSWNGTIAIYNYNSPALPMTAVMELDLSIPNLLEGTVDFFNTASVRMSLPAGFTAHSSSGLPLFEPPAAVAAPATGGLLVLALCLVGVVRQRGWRVRGPGRSVLA